MGQSHQLLLKQFWLLTVAEHSIGHLRLADAFTEFRASSLWFRGSTAPVTRTNSEALATFPLKIPYGASDRSGVCVEWRLPRENLGVETGNQKADCALGWGAGCRPRREAYRAGSARWVPI